jgi:hypothetical protein
VNKRQGTLALSYCAIPSVKSHLGVFFNLSGLQDASVYSYFHMEVRELIVYYFLRYTCIAAGSTYLLIPLLSQRLGILNSCAGNQMTNQYFTSLVFPLAIMTSIQVADLHVDLRLQHMLHASFQEESREDITYAVIIEFLLQYKHPVGRFVLYPQMSLHWKPNNPKDTRKEIPDISIGNFTLQVPYFKMRLGVEAKRLLGVMVNLPEPMAIEGHEDVMIALHILFYQGEDQAKAAIKGGHTHTNTIPYLPFIGPYFMPVKYGPFNPNQLGVRTLKSSDSADYTETMMANIRFKSPPIQHKIYLLGTNDAAIQLDNIISETDALAEPLIQEAASYQCMLISCPAYPF